MQFDDKLFLFYTGNVRDENWVRHPYQIGALLDKSGKLEKIDKVLIEQPAEATDHFRDPQIFNYKGRFYAIVGGQNLDKQGYVKLYKAVDNDYSNWEVVGNLDFANDKTAYMMECPNLVFINDQPVLLYCPQGLSKEVLDYGNIYHSAFISFYFFDFIRLSFDCHIFMNKAYSTFSGNGNSQLGFSYRIHSRTHNRNI